jgi:hypothetical protein
MGSIVKIWPGLTTPIALLSTKKHVFRKRCKLYNQGIQLTGVMRNIRCTMEQLVNTVATEGTDNRETVLGSMFFNDFTEITISDSRLDYFGILEK